MIRLLCLLSLIVLVTGDHEQDWIMFKSKHNNSYESPIVESLRKSIFVKNQEYIRQFNTEKSHKLGFKLAVNHLADKTPDETLSLTKGLKLDKRNKFVTLAGSQEEDYLNRILNNNSIKVPDELDWRSFPNRVTEVKDQGSSCGSCWAFSTTGVLEGQEALKKRKTSFKLTALSEQNLVDCSKDNHGCNGGNFQFALNSIEQEGGIEDEESYPYEAVQKECRFNKKKAVFTDSGAATLEGADEEKLKELVAKYGPVSVGIVAENHDFRFYQSGVYYNENCGDQLGHAVLLVGYGTDPKHGDYWIVVSIQFL